MILELILPVWNEDIFLKYRPFPEKTDNLFLMHWHEAVASFLFYSFIQWISPWIGKSWVGDSYRQLNNKTRTNFDIHVVSFVQCIISIVVLVPMWNHPSWQNSPQDPETSIFGYYPYSGFVAAIMTGYFMWDLLVCLKYLHWFGVGFLFHAFAALYVFVGLFLPFCLPWAPGFLLFELSTPFVNINWFASRLPAVFSEKVVFINGLILLAVFFSVRLVWGLYCVYLLTLDLFAVWDKLNPIIPTITLFLNALLNVLNAFWFYKMIVIAKSKIGRSSKAKAKEVADKID